MNEKPHNTRVTIGRVRVSMYRWRRIEGLANHNRIAGKSNNRILFRVVHMLIHIDQHIVSTGVVLQVLHCVIPIRSRIVGGR